MIYSIIIYLYNNIYNTIFYIYIYIYEGNTISFSVLALNNTLENRQLAFFLLERIANYLKSSPMRFFKSNLSTW